MFNFNHAGWDWAYNVAALRSTQAFLGTITGTAVNTIYTVPAGKRFIVKVVTAQNISAGNVDFQLRTGATGTIWHFNLTGYGTGGDRGQLTSWIVLNPGDTIAFQRSVAGSCTVTVSGSLHTI